MLMLHHPQWTIISVWGLSATKKNCGRQNFTHIPFQITGLKCQLHAGKCRNVCGPVCIFLECKISSQSLFNFGNIFLLKQKVVKAPHLIYYPALSKYLIALNDSSWFPFTSVIYAFMFLPAGYICRYGSMYTRHFCRTGIFTLRNKWINDSMVSQQPLGCGTS